MAKRAKRLQAQTKSSIFNPFDPISIIALLLSFKLVCDTNGIDEGAAIWFIHFFMKEETAAALNSRIIVSSRSWRKPYKEKHLNAL